jgi:hypothetical protein
VTGKFEVAGKKRFGLALCVAVIFEFPLLDLKTRKGAFSLVVEAVRR